MNFSDNLKQIRKEHNLSQEQIAEKLGVSRQSVSKWESGQAYPEMDKMIQLCQIFNLNIDDLLNQDIKEVNNNKQAKSNINKFIDDFLEYMTKTIDMFSSMKFKEQVKCIIEQIVNITFIGVILVLIGLIGGVACSYLFAFLPINIYYKLLYVIGALYILFSLILGIIVLLHIFKIRYLDYYVVVKRVIQNETDKSQDSKKSDDKLEESRKIVLEKKIEKVIIRDPDHSGYKFLSWLVRMFLICMKLMAGFIGILGCITLVLFVVGLIISFVFIKTGLLFVGVLLGLLALITINLIILNIIYNFIVSKENKKSKQAISFVCSLVLGGIGIGLCLIGISKFDVVEEMNYETVLNFEMNENITFIADTDIEYVESDNDNIKVIVKHNKLHSIVYEEYKDNYVHIHHYLDSGNFMKSIREQINSINEYKLVDYKTFKIYVYTNKQNIKQLKKNHNQYYDYQTEIEFLNNELNSCTNEKISCENDFQQLKEELNICNVDNENYQVEIDSLKEQISELENN